MPRGQQAPPTPGTKPTWQAHAEEVGRQAHGMGSAKPLQRWLCHQQEERALQPGQGGESRLKVGLGEPEKVSRAGLAN